jgi:hypothetical protein
MKSLLLFFLVVAFAVQAVLAQQFNPPAPSPGAMGKADIAEAEILKVYTMEDQGATFRAYVVKYKGNEVVVSDDLSATTRKVGENINFYVTRVELPLPTGGKIHSLMFKFKPGLPGKK